jgi:MFS superfamily sulfate permease-like transporter
MFPHIKDNFKAGLVVFLVALPLCLGIALSQGAPLFSGIISGVVGGIVVALISKSKLSVSGPAAGLTSVVPASVLSLSASTRLGLWYEHRLYKRIKSIIR